MNDEENLIAEQIVPIQDQQSLTVRISQNTTEEFWRVAVTNPSMDSSQVSTTVAPGDSFMMNLIEDAVDGKQVAWRHLAQWGHTNLGRGVGGSKPIFA